MTTPLTLHTRRAAPAGNHAPPADASGKDFGAISGRSIGEIGARIKHIQDDDEEASLLPFY
ncbi:MAG TPA: hypothetical protein VN832_04200 [Stellaceae bacterium]|nr:hypothetical protein [Stellaceae bacterium]